MPTAEEAAAQIAPVMGRPGDPCIMVICGASGDLTKRKLIPALYNLASENLLSKSFALVGFARNQMTSEEFRNKISEEISQFATGAVDQDCGTGSPGAFTMCRAISTILRPMPA